MGYIEYKVPGVKRPLRLSPEHAKDLGAKPAVKGSDEGDLSTVTVQPDPDAEPSGSASAARKSRK